MTYYYNQEKGFFYNAFFFLKLNFIYSSSVLLACIILGSLTNTISKALITIVFWCFWAYFVHVYAHKTPAYINLHKIHHTPSINNKWWGVLIEILVNIFATGGFTLVIINIILENSYDISLLHNYTLLYVSFLYSTFHMINYHILNVQTHINHHKHEKYNYGPDIMDMLFGTKLNKDEIENMNHGIINSVIILAVLLLTYNTKFDIVKILQKNLKIR